MSPDIEALATHIGSGEAHLPFSSKVELAEVLTVLQRAKFFFADELTGWPPAAVFQQLREESLVSGVVLMVSWRSQNAPVFGDV
ncbi:hypothetical protein CPter91_0235 [Collimonas pratensis]|uniref:Uncharacterized protein n=2 Tax=Collimonas pratensis TaxID=279113 RepID=A0A127PY07_9BURK|nr:hypothetical protein CPter91_0235 [Collimonas pratensis]